MAGSGRNHAGNRLTAERYACCQRKSAGPRARSRLAPRNPGNYLRSYQEPFKCTAGNSRVSFGWRWIPQDFAHCLKINRYKPCR